VKFITTPGGSGPQNSSDSSGMAPDITATNKSKMWAEVSRQVCDKQEVLTEFLLGILNEICFW